MSIVNNDNLKASLNQFKEKIDSSFTNIDNRLNKFDYTQKINMDNETPFLFATGTGVANFAMHKNTTSSAYVSFSYPV